MFAGGPRRNWPYRSPIANWDAVAPRSAVRTPHLPLKVTDEVLAEEGAAAEYYEIPDALPDDVEVSRPNLAQPTVVSVRLSADVRTRLQRAAESANLTVLTVSRIWALGRPPVEQGGRLCSAYPRCRDQRLHRVVNPMVARCHVPPHYWSPI